MMSLWTSEQNDRRVCNGCVPNSKRDFFVEVDIYYRNHTSKTDKDRYCGGTIISRHTVITAAHCVEGLNITMVGNISSSLLDLNMSEDT